MSSSMIAESRAFLLTANAHLGYSDGEHLLIESGDSVGIRLVFPDNDILSNDPVEASYTIFDEETGTVVATEVSITPASTMTFVVVGLTNDIAPERLLRVQIKVLFDEQGDEQTIKQMVWVRKAYVAPGSPVTAGQMRLRLSGGSANNNPAIALGGVKSIYNAPQAVFGTLAPSDEDRVLYRCVYVENGGASTLTGALVWIGENSDEAELNIGLGTSVVGGVEQTITDQLTPPVGVTFSEPDEDTPLTIGGIPAGHAKAVWLRLTIDADAVSFPGVSILVGGNFG